MKHTVNQRIKLLRTELGLSQTQFAVECKLSLPAISRMETSDTEPTEKAIRAICKAFNSNEVWLKTEKGDMFLEGGVKTNEPQNPWQDEAYKQVKEENLTLRQQLDKLTQALLNLSSRANPNFLKASDVAGIPLYLLNKAGYSVANAQC